MKDEGKPITFVRGVKALGKAVGIKSNGNKDFCVVYLKNPSSYASVFTKNSVKAAPVLVNAENLIKSNGVAQALFVVSGCANACTGEKGIADAKEMAQLISRELKVKPEHVVVSSTGVIGKFLPMDKLQDGVKGVSTQLSDSAQSGLDASLAITTTDTRMKTIAVEVDGVRFAGMCKGAGMIHPNMATMLAYVFTDAQISSFNLKNALSFSVEKTFNLMSVDGCTSTNDTLAVFATGESGKSLSEEKFQKALDFVCLQLAKKIVSDGEGVTKVFETTVKNARSQEDAKKMVLSIINSPLVKTAVYGNDANWGRVIQAIGSTQIKIDLNSFDVFFNDLQLVKNGVEQAFDESAARKIMSQKEFTITVDLKLGGASVTGWGCDLTEEYIKINAEYTT